MTTLDQLIESTRRAVQSKNWYAALGLALALPDICGWLESPNRGTKARYQDWGRRYIEPLYTSKTQKSLTAEDLYGFRCAFLHQGSGTIDQIKASNALKNFRFVAGHPASMFLHNIRQQGLIVLRIDRFVESICEAAEAWKADVVDGSPIISSRLSELLDIQIFD